MSNTRRGIIITFSLVLLLISCFLWWAVSTSKKQITDRPLADSNSKHDSAGLPQSAQLGQAAGAQTSANETGPLFLLQRKSQSPACQFQCWEVCVQRCRRLKDIEPEQPKGDRS